MDTLFHLPQPHATGTGGSLNHAESPVTGFAPEGAW